MNNLIEKTNKMPDPVHEQDHRGIMVVYYSGEEGIQTSCTRCSHTDTVFNVQDANKVHKDCPGAKPGFKTWPPCDS